MGSRFKIATPNLDRFDQWLANKHKRLDRSEIILFSIILTYTIFFSVLTVLRHWAFQTHAWDTGILTQSLWTTNFGNKFLYHTPELYINPSGSFFGTHFSPILLALSPIYRVAPTPETLLIIQAFFLALAAFPIYLLAKNFASGRTVGLVFAGVYLIYPAIQYVNLYEFHVQAFLPFLMTFTIYYVAKENWRLYFPFLFLSLMVEEHVAQIVAFLGVYLLWRYKSPIITALKNKNFLDKRLLISLITIALGLIWYWFTLWQRDTFFPTNPAAMNEFLGVGNFGTLGAKSPLEVPLAIILKPANAFQALLNDGAMKLLYFVMLFGPLAFFSFASPALLIPTIPNFMFSLVSDGKIHHMLGVHYEAYTVSFIFAAAIFGLQKINQKQGLKKFRSGLKIMMLLSLIFFVAASPVGPVVSNLYPNYASITYGTHEQALTNILATIPANASILTQNNLFPHVSNRVQAYVIPSVHFGSTLREEAISFTEQTLNEVEYVLVDNKTDALSTTFALSLLENNTDFYLKDNFEDTIFLYARQH